MTIDSAGTLLFNSMELIDLLIFLTRYLIHLTMTMFKYWLPKVINIKLFLLQMSKSKGAFMIIMNMGTLRISMLN